MPPLTSDTYRVSLSSTTTRSSTAVLNAYGWPHASADEDILARLLALNLARAAAQGGAVAASAADETPGPAGAGDDE
jgi:hypothetical protein